MTPKSPKKPASAEALKHAREIDIGDWKWERAAAAQKHARSVVIGDGLAVAVSRAICDVVDEYIGKYGAEEINAGIDAAMKETAAKCTALGAAALAASRGAGALAAAIKKGGLK
ncbi:MAG: hypothetical protein LBI02_09995 [Opitutaceae bacterium]|jgi:hypothetical protein|nr:hypothetical protein [Opitutaceae bacterium]